MLEYSPYSFVDNLPRSYTYCGLDIKSIITIHKEDENKASVLFLVKK